MSQGRRFVWLGASAAFRVREGFASFSGVPLFSRGCGNLGRGSSEAGQTPGSDDNDSNPMHWNPDVRGIPPWPSKGAKS
jgi:hypothetical protein